MAALSTPWSRAMGLRAPILDAPMGGVAGGALATAISAAGGLGGVGSAGYTSLIEEETIYPRNAGTRFGIGLLDWAVTREPALLEVALSVAPVLVSVSFGDKWPWVEQVRSAGVITATQISNVEEAQRAEEAGIELLVARGAEGGGHGDPSVGTLPLLEGVLDSVSVPVLAAGGISSPRGLAAVLAAGAAGAWLGTAFAACPESLSSDGSRDALLHANETETIITGVFDLALGYGWPSKFPERIVRNDLSAQWSGREQELDSDPELRAALVDTISVVDHQMAHVNAGQGVGLLNEVRTAAEIVDWMCTGAADLLSKWA